MNQLQEIKSHLAQIEQRENAATEGPWLQSSTHVHSYTAQANVASASEPQGRTDVGYDEPKRGTDGLKQAHKNATFIAHSRADIPKLRKALEMAMEALEDMHTEDDIRRRNRLKESYLYSILTTLKS